MKKAVSILATMFMFGCAVAPQVAVDPKSIVDKAKYKEDLADCRAVAQSYDLSGSSLKNAAVGAAAGGAAMAGVTAAVAGTVVGGAIPFILAASAAGAGLGGGTTKVKETGAREKIMAECMNERGYKAYAAH